jgi:hypothetical protein
MNENLSIDIEAEKKTFSEIISPSNLSESVVNTVQPVVNLPESIPIRPTEINVQADGISDFSKTTLKLEVGFDAEAAVKNLSSRISDLDQSISDQINSLSNKWLPDPRASNKFDERPTTNSLNFIFDVRSIEFAEPPKWS